MQKPAFSSRPAPTGASVLRAGPTVRSRTIYLIYTRLVRAGYSRWYAGALGDAEGCLKDVITMSLPRLRQRYLAGELDDRSARIDRLHHIPRPAPPDRVLFFDNARRPLSGDLPVVSIARPGILFAIATDPGVHDPDFDERLYGFQRHVEIDVDLMMYACSRDAQFVPRQFAEVDVVLCHASADRRLAADLVARLRMAGVTVFAAEHGGDDARIDTEAQRWIRGSATLVVLETPSSTGCAWVRFAMGAAWALGLPITVALSALAASGVPDAMTPHRKIDVDTNEGRTAFVDGIVGVLGAAERLAARPSIGH